MAMPPPKGPQNGIGVVLGGLTRFSTRDDPSPGAAQVDRPHPVYHLDAAAVAQNKGLESAELTGYRYLVDEDGRLSTADVSVDASRQMATRMVRRGFGPYPQAFAEALAQVEKLPAVAAGSYELRVLQCPAVFLATLWLKGGAGQQDILYPLAPAPDGVEAEHEYTADQFLGLVRTLVQNRLAPHL